MSENYGIVLGIDAAQAESGSKATTAAINTVVSSLEKLQQRATSAFAALDRASQRSDFSKLSRDAANQVGAAQDMAIAYNALGGAVKRAQSILNQRISGTAAASLASLGREIARFTGQMNQLAETKGFSNLRSLGSILGGMKFSGPSPAAVRNFQGFLNVVGTANVAQLNAVAQAMQGFSNIRAPRLPVAPRPQANVNPAVANVAGGTAGVSRVRASLEGLNNTLSMSYQLSTVLRVALGSLTLGHFAKDIFDATATMQQFDRMVEAVATSEQEASQNKTFIDQLTRDLPIGLSVAQQSFGKFNASIRLSGESAENSRKLFSQLSTSFAVLHLSTEQMNNAFLAVEEMFNKGTITSQQLKRQLSQYLPGAFELVAASVGKTTSQLAALMEQGQVPAKVMFKLGDILQSIYGPELAAAMVTSRNQLTLLSNDVQKFMQSIGKNGFDSGLSSMLQGIRQAMGASDLETAAKRIGEGFQTAFTMIGAAASVLIENWDTVAKVLMGFTGFTVLSLGITALTALFGPFLGILGYFGEALLLTGSAGAVAAGGISAAGAAAGTAAPALAAAATATGVVGTAAAGAGTAAAAAGTAAAGTVGLWGRFSGAVGKAGSTVMRAAGTFAKGFAYTELAMNLPMIGDLAGQATEKLMDMTNAAEFLVKNHPDIAKGIMDAANLVPKVDFKDGWGGMLFGNGDAADKAKEEGAKVGNAAKDGIQQSLSKMSPEAKGLLKALGFDKLYDEFANAKSKIESFNADYKAKMEKVDNEIFQANKKRQEELDKLHQQSLENTSKKMQQLLQKIDPIAKARADAQQEQQILDQLLQKKLINEEQYQAYKKRLDYENLKTTNPYSAVVRGYEEQFAVLKQTGDARDTENKLLQLRNQLLKEGVDIDSKANAGLRENLRALIDSQRELERGGSNGFARWSAGLKTFREDLIDVEKNGVEKLSDGLADLSVGKGMDISKIGMGVLRDFNKSMINDLMRKAIDPIKGMNSPLASIFGLGAPNPDKALAGAKAVQDSVKPITSKGLMDQISAGTLDVTAGTVNVNGSVAGMGGTGAKGVTDLKVKANDSPIVPGTALSPTQSAQAASNDFRIAGNKNIMSSGQFAGSMSEPKKTATDQLAGGTGLIDNTFSKENSNALFFGGSAGSAATNAKFNVSTMDADHIARVVQTEADGRLMKTNPAEYDKQVQGTIDTILNRRASGKFGNSIDDVVNQKNQFSKINGPANLDPYGSVANAPAATPALQDKVNSYLASRANGAPPSFGDSMYYANPNYSTANNMDWVNYIKQNGAGSAGSGKMIHYFGNPQGVQGPGQYSFGFGDSAGTSAASASIANQPMLQVTDATKQLELATSQTGTSLTGVATDFSQVASSAQGATGGLGSMIPMLGKLMSGAGGAAGGAGGLFGMFKEGGYSTSPVSAYAASTSAFRNVPHYAEGTGKAARAPGTASLGGGFPAVLHDNEAVIPLTRGREVPVALTGGAANSNQGSQNTTNVHLHGVKDFDSFRKSKSQVRAQMATETHLASQRNN